MLCRTVRVAGLPGEFSDDYSIIDLARDLGLRDDDEHESGLLLDECADAYNDAASEAFWAEVERIARDHLDTDAIVGLRDAGYTICWLDPAALDSSGCVSPYAHYRHDTPLPDRRAWADLSSIAKDEDAYGQSSTLERSNYRSLERDHPEVWTPVDYSNVNGLGAFISDLTPELVTAHGGNDV